MAGRNWLSGVTLGAQAVARGYWRGTCYMSVTGELWDEAYVSFNFGRSS